VGASGGRVGAWYEAEVEAQLLQEVKASRPLICVLVINDNHYGLTILSEL
jgi:hypothetical protein